MQRHDIWMGDTIPFFWIGAMRRLQKGDAVSRKTLLELCAFATEEDLDVDRCMEFWREQLARAGSRSMIYKHDGYGYGLEAISFSLVTL